MTASLVMLALAGLLAAVPSQEHGSSVRLVRAAAGPRGSAVGGRFVFEEERSTFNRGRDTQIIVAFEWEGSPGKHRLSATWRNLEAAASSTSEIEHEARDRRFGAYWTFPLTAATPVGKWRLEAAVDGQPAGVFEFEIVDAESVPVKTSRRILSPAELYHRTNAALVIIERLNAADGTVDVDAGFVLAGDRVVTAFSAIDGARRLRLTLPDGKRLEVTALLGWNRPQDWAVIGATSPGGDALQLAATPPAVGDRCYSVEVSAEAARILVEGSIAGQHTAGKAGPRLLASFLTGFATRGAPVLNDAGELVGFVGGSAGSGIAGPHRSLRLRLATTGVPVVPMALVQPPARTSAVPLGELVTRGVLTLPVEREQNILSAGFAPRVIKQGPATQPVDQRYEFSRADASMVVFVTWNPQERLRGVLSMRIHDEDNRVVGESKAKKVDLRVGRTLFTDWTIQVPAAAGMYRVDVLIDGRPVWRDFFRVTG
jgi:hypothetical protein